MPPVKKRPARKKTSKKTSKRSSASPRGGADGEPSPERRGRKKGAPRPTSDQILEAAEKVFAHQGFADTSLRQLIAAARVSTTAFYARFASREAVLEAIATRFLNQLANDTAAQLSEAEGIEDAFLAGVDLLATAVEGKRPLLRLLLGEAGGNEAVRLRLAAAFEQLASLMGGNLQRLVDKGIIEPSDARATGWAIIGALKIQLERWALLEAISADELRPALRSTAVAMLPVIKRRSR
jgi:AcrR family transcriptional regulator